MKGIVSKSLPYREPHERGRGVGEKGEKGNPRPREAGLPPR